MNSPASIIIASYNRLPDLLPCLHSLPWPTLVEMGIEVIVFDDGSTDGTADCIRTQFPQVKCLRSEQNLGLAQAHNMAAAEASGRLLINIDSDVLVQPGWLEAYLDADDGQTVLGGAVIDYRTRLPQGGPRRFTIIGKSIRVATHRANVATGCNLAIPKQVFDSLGGFDEDLPYYFEDRDLCIRAHDAGYSFNYVEDAVVLHKGSATPMGPAIRLQERHSCYAMLKRYRHKPLRWGLYTLLNSGWLAARVCLWTITGRIEDARRLLQGWREAYARFLLHPSHY